MPRDATAHKLGRRGLIAGLLAFPAAGRVFASAASAEPLRCIVPFGADGESSTAARLQRPILRDLTGQDMVVDYRPGGGGAVVWSAVNRLPADGRTIIGVNLPHILLQPAAGAKYRTSDLALIHIFHHTPHAIAVRANAPFDTLQDLVQAAKTAPGSIVFTGSGSNTASHLAQRRFDLLAGMRTNYLPFEGTTAAIAALLAGETRAAWTYPTVGVQYDRSVRLLAIATAERHPRFPSVPTFQEFGYPLVDGTWRGIAVPKATPESARQSLSDLFMTIANRPALKRECEERAMSPIAIGLPDMPAFLADRTTEYLALAQAAGMVE